MRPYSVISVSAVRRTLSLLSRAASVPVIAVVKDDAYGHGAEVLAQHIADMVCLFAVSSVEEGVRLRVAGIREGVLVLTPVLRREEALRAKWYRLTVTVASAEGVALCAGLSAHIAFNTGMNRFGFAPQEAARACRLCRAHKVRVEGVYSHLYDASDASAVRAQTQAFKECCAAVRAVFPSAMRHLCATGGILAGGAPLDAVRPGLGLYGYAPPPFSDTLGLTPALRVYAHVLHAAPVYGSGAGYGAAQKRYAALHTLGAGYGDGFFRAGGLGAVGALCMDACVREGALPAGRRVCVLDDAAAYAKEHGTTAYEVLTMLRGLRKYYAG